MIGTIIKKLFGASACYYVIGIKDEVLNLRASNSNDPDHIIACAAMSTAFLLQNMDLVGLDINTDELLYFLDHPEEDIVRKGVSIWIRESEKFSIKSNTAKAEVPKQAYQLCSIYYSAICNSIRDDSYLKIFKQLMEASVGALLLIDAIDEKRLKKDVDPFDVRKKYLLLKGVPSSDRR